MKTRTGSSRFFMPATALLVMLAAMFFASNTALAQTECCEFSITNNSSCTIRFCMLVFGGSGDPHCFNVLPGQQYAREFPPPCPMFNIYIKDACGDLRLFPQTVGECITIRYDASGSGGCCITICYTAPCQWTISDADPAECEPCD